MGDVGSGYLGYVVAVLALASMHDSAVAIWVWLILGGVFFVDATVTLLRRLSRGQRVYQAHRSHAYQWLARRWGSHLRVTLALLGVDVCWLLPCAAFAALHPRYAAATTVLALVGFADDNRPLSPVTRLAVHCGAALWALLCLGGLPPLSIAGRSIAFGWPGYVLGTLGIVWSLNLFNFMDGIDGIAASEAAFVALAGAALTLLAAGPPEVGFTGLVLAAACGGFLLWNWPPAKIFLGDVGSGYLGYVIVVLALVAARDHPAALWTWLILGGAFFVDATVTLVRRSLRRERLHQAHRTHAYQWLAQRWGSHLRVTLAVIIVDVLWLLPCAILSVLRPALAAVTTLVALAPLVVLAILAGSGRAAEREPS